MPRTVEGGCHCGAVRFRATLREERVVECNCSICRMKGLLHAFVAQDDFELSSGAEALTTYTFNTGVAKHTFCRVCGVQPFYRPRSHPDHVDVNPRCFDGGVPADLEVVSFDGERWDESIDRLR
jgi:hypothetical protein